MKGRLLALATIATLLVAGILPVLLLPIAVQSQWATIYTNQISPANTSAPVGIGPSATSGCFVNGTTGEMSCTQAHTDGYAFLPAQEVVGCADANNANRFVPTRVNSNDWPITHPNGTINGTTAINCVATLNAWIQRVGGTKGVKINSIDFVYQITGAALTAHNLACQQTNGVSSGCLGGLATVQYANNTANVVGSNQATLPTLALNTQTNPYLTNVAVATPFFFPANIRQSFMLEWQATPAVNTVYRIYGLGINFSVLAE